MLFVWLSVFVCGMIAGCVFAAIARNYVTHRRPKIDSSLLLHRDDIPFDEAEAIVQEMQERHPGCVVRFAGDVPPEQLPLELARYIFWQQDHFRNSLRTGCCVDCGVIMPNYKNRSKASRLEEGWFALRNNAGKLMGWQCPACDAEEKSDE